MEHEEAAQVEEETSGIARAGAEAPATTPTVASASDQESPGPATVLHTESDSASPASKAAAALTDWPGGPRPSTLAVDPAIDAETPPLRQVSTLDAEAFFAEGAELMRIHPPHPNDHPVLQRLTRLRSSSADPWS